MVKLDVKDRRILATLDMNARLPINELARKVGVSRQVARYRLERLKKEGVILGALTIFETAVIGYPWFRVLIRMGGAKNEQRQEIISWLCQHPASVWVAGIGGNWDIIVNFLARDNFEFNGILEDFLGRYGRFVQAYETLTYIHIRDQPRGYLFRPDETEVTFFAHSMQQATNFGLDKTDLAIVRLMATHAGLGQGEMAGKIGVSDKTVAAHIHRMEDAGFILGYRLVVHPQAIGYESYMVLLEIHNLQREREGQLHAFLHGIPHVIHIVTHIGRWRIGMEAEVKNRTEFQEFLVQLRDRFGDIISDFEVFPIFRDYHLNYAPPWIQGERSAPVTRKS